VKKTKAKKKVLKTYALIGFLVSGRSNIICTTQAEDDYSAAAKLGGRLIEPAQMHMSDMEVYSYRLPPSPSGVSWGEFKFNADEAIDQLVEKTEPEGNWLTSAKNVGRHSDHLVLAEVPFLG
jgi:hypothetical protein